jgi:hypothetical protein
MAKATKEQFYASFANAKLADLQSAATSEGYTLTSTRRSDAVDELWALYSGRAAAPESPAAPSPAPSDRPLVWEARKSSKHPGESFRRAGYVFGRRFEVLDPQPSADQLARLQAETMVQIRIKE